MPYQQCTRDRHSCSRNFLTKSGLSDWFAGMEEPAISADVLQPDVQREASSEWVSQSRKAFRIGEAGCPLVAPLLLGGYGRTRGP